MKKTILGMSMFLLMLSSVNLFSQARTTNSATFTLGVVEIETIVKEMPEALSADRELQELTKKWEDSIVAKRTDLETRAQNYQRQKAMMAAAAQQQEEEKFAMEAQELQILASEAQNAINQTRERLLEPIRAKVKSAIEAVAKDEKISMVLSKEAALIMYYEPRLDITFRVIDKIKRNK